MNKVDSYRQILSNLDDWEPFLRQESHLPGPRGNLELVQAVVEEGDEALFRQLLAYGPERAPTNTPEEFLAVCGVVGLGKLLAAGQTQVLETLRLWAGDPRWRVREGVCMALQRFGEKDMASLLAAMEQWSQGSLLEKRAAAATLCEPKLLVDPEHARRTLQILDGITASLPATGERRGDDFQVLRKGLAYCWSVAVAALPAHGKPLMGGWFASKDRDVRWIMQENLKKKRLARMDAAWVEHWKATLEKTNLR